MNVLKIVKEYLIKNGYDGLYNDNGCGCEFDDLAPGSCLGDCCEPGHKMYCDNNENPSEDWYIR